VVTKIELEGLLSLVMVALLSRLSRFEIGLNDGYLLFSINHQVGAIDSSFSGF